MKLTRNCLVVCLGWLAAAGVPALLAAAEPIRLAGCRIKPADQVTLSANQSGVLALVPREGETVETGQKVIRLEDDLARFALAIADKEATNDVDIRHAIAISEVERLEHEQNSEVNDRTKGAVSLSEIRRAKLEFDRSLLGIEQARHKQSIAILKRNEAAANLKTFAVVSPIAGTVTKVIKQKGESVRPGEAVLELVNTRQVRVEGFLDAVHRRQVRPGTSVTIECEEAGSESARVVGKIVFVDAVVQPVTQQVRISAEVDNADELLVPGLTATMIIVPENRPVTANR